MSYWLVGLPQHDQSAGSMEQHTDSEPTDGSSVLQGGQGAAGAVPCCSHHFLLCCRASSTPQHNAVHPLAFVHVCRPPPFVFSPSPGQKRILNGGQPGRRTRGSAAAGREAMGGERAPVEFRVNLASPIQLTPLADTKNGLTVGPAEEMGAKTSLLDGSEGGPVLPSPTLENIKAAYEDQQVEVARELIQQACCVECSAGTPRVPGVNLLCVAIQHGDQQSVQYLLKEARVPVPLDPSSTNPAILAAHCGHATLVKELLDSVPGPCLRMDLLNWMLATSCQQGHMDVVRLLVHSYHANVRDCAIHSDDFAVISGLPLYAAAQAGNEDVAQFLLQSGAGFSSYMLMDHPAFSKHLLRLRLQDSPVDGGQVRGAGAVDGGQVRGAGAVDGGQTVSVCWSHLQLPWLELDWFMDMSSRIVHLDLSSNCLVALPSVLPWGLLHLLTLDLSNNLLKELPAVHTSQEVICSRLRQVNLSNNQLATLPSGFLHLTLIQSVSAAKNQLRTLFDIPNSTLLF
ncbi:Leucine-rich repeat serine/threonine-protein kinase 1 [Takifugu flavidus]|uniref:Leucine-rich repeat serine/threonine-protein kinase 1 n=1 Tax=Takifugu flavidus TaxID=433684 RepID=A0A5C6NK68_9TELE|nr:Leucine-rich repeat serine/threonine-protein kinase 1 [Takifugu flavidus]